MIRLAALLALLSGPVAAQEPAHGTELNFTFQGEGFTVLFWPLEDKVQVSRDINGIGLGLGDFPANTAAAVATAGLQLYGMACTLAAPELYRNVPGLYDVFYRC